MRGLDGDRQAVLLGKGQHLGGARHGARRTGHERRAYLGGDAARGHLVAQGFDGFRARPDPDEAGRAHGTGEFGPLGQETVARVHGIGTAAASDVDELGDVEVGICGA